MIVNKNTIVICVTVFATITSVAWAITTATIYSPAKSALERCAENYDARQTPFCNELVRKSEK